MLSSISGESGIVPCAPRSDMILLYRRNGFECRQLQLRRTAQKKQFLPVLIMHSELAERIRAVFDALPDFIFLLFCVFIFGYLLQGTADESIAILEIRKAKQELGLRLVQSVENSNSVMVPFQ